MKAWKAALVVCCVMYRVCFTLRQRACLPKDHPDTLAMAGSAPQWADLPGWSHLLKKRGMVYLVNMLTRGEDVHWYGRTRAHAW